MPKLHIYYKIPLFLIITAISIINAEEPRFNRIIRLYNNYNYLEERRNILFDLQTLIDNDQAVDTIIANEPETAFFNTTNIVSILTLQLKKDVGTFYKEKAHTFNVSIFFDKKDRINKLTNPSFFFDYNEYFFGINSQLNFQASKYLLRNKKTTPFIQIKTNLTSSLSHLKKLCYDKDLDVDWSIERKQNATFLLNLPAAIGIGKQKDVNPIYQTFFLEKKLIKNGVANFRLSDKTLSSIAKLLAENNTYKFKKHEKIIEFKSKLDSIIAKDPSVKKENLRYISPLEIKKILLCNAPVLMTKPKLKLFTTSHAAFELNRIDNEYLYDELDISNDTSYIKPKLRYEHLLGIDFAWGIPFTRFWFLNVRALRHLLSTDRKIDFYDKNKIKWDEALDIRWDIQSSLWFTNWILIQMGLKNLPAWIAVPRESPYSSYMNFNIFIEDYLSLTTAISYFKFQHKHYSYLKWHEPLNRAYNGLVINITVLYNY